MGRSEYLAQLKARSAPSQADTGSPGDVVEQPAPADTQTEAAPPGAQPDPRELTGDLQAKTVRDQAARKALGPDTNPSLIEDLNRDFAQQDPTDGVVKVPPGQPRSSEAAREKLIGEESRDHTPARTYAFDLLHNQEAMDPEDANELLDQIPDEELNRLIRGVRQRSPIATTPTVDDGPLSERLRNYIQAQEREKVRESQPNPLDAARQRVLRMLMNEEEEKRFTETGEQ